MGSDCGDRRGENPWILLSLAMIWDRFSCGGGGSLCGGGGGGLTANFGRIGDRSGDDSASIGCCSWLIWFGDS